MNVELDSIGEFARSFSALNSSRILIPEEPIGPFQNTTLDDSSFFKNEKGSTWIPKSILEETTGVPPRIKLEMVKRDINIHLSICRYLNNIVKSLELCSSDGGEYTPPADFDLKNAIIMTKDDIDRILQIETDSLSYHVGKLKDVREDDGTVIPLISLESTEAFTFQFQSEETKTDDQLLGFNLMNDIKEQLDKEQRRITLGNIVSDIMDTTTSDEIPPQLDPNISGGSVDEDNILVFQRTLDSTHETISLLWLAIEQLIESSSLSCDGIKIPTVELQELSSVLSKRTQATIRLADHYPDRRRDISKWFTPLRVSPVKSLESIASRSPSLPIQMDENTSKNEKKIPYDLEDAMYVSSFLVSEYIFANVVEVSDGTGVTEEWQQVIYKSSFQVVGIYPIEVMAEPNSKGSLLCLWYSVNNPGHVFPKVDFDEVARSMSDTLGQRINFESFRLTKVKDELDRRDKSLYHSLEVDPYGDFEGERECVRDKATPDQDHPLHMFYSDKFKQRDSCQVASSRGECSADSIPVISRVSGKLIRCCEEIRTTISSSNTKGSFTKEEYMKSYNILRRRAWETLITLYDQLEEHVHEIATKLSKIKVNVDEKTFIEMETSVNLYLQTAKSITKDIGYCMQHQKDPQCVNLYEFLNEILVLFQQHETQHSITLALLNDINAKVNVVVDKTKQQPASSLVYNIFSSVVNAGKTITNFVWKNKMNLAFYGVIICGGVALPFITGVVRGLAGPSLLGGGSAMSILSKAYDVLLMKESPNVFGFGDIASVISKANLIVSNVVCDALSNPLTNILFVRYSFKCFIWMVSRGYLVKFFTWLVELGSAIVPGVGALVLGLKTAVGAATLTADIIMKSIEFMYKACGSEWVRTGDFGQKATNITTILFAAFRYYFAWVFDWVVGIGCNSYINASKYIIKTVNVFTGGWADFKFVSSFITTNEADKRYLLDETIKNIPIAPSGVSNMFRSASRFNTVVSNTYAFQYLPYFVPIAIVTLLLYSSRTKGEKMPPLDDSQPQEKWAFESL